MAILKLRPSQRTFMAYMLLNYTIYVYQLYIILYDIHHIKIIPNHIPDLGLIVDVADLLDDESELIVPGQRLVHHVEV